MTSDRRRHRVRDLILYVLISGLLLSVMLFFIIRGVAEAPFMRWLGFAFLTTLVFGFFVERSRKLWHRPAFWSISIFLFLIHTGIYLSLTRHGELLRGFWFYLIGLSELALLNSIRILLTRRRR